MASPRNRIVTVALLFTSACSWITVNAPPDRPVARNEKLTCTTSTAAPVTDTVLGSAALLAGGTGVAFGIAGLSGCDASTCWISQPMGITYAALGAALVGLAVMEGFSAAHGYTTTADCRALERNQLACVSGVEASCVELQYRGKGAGK